MPTLTSHPYTPLLDRAQALAATQDQEWVTPAQARDITGLTRRQLTTAADTGAMTVNRPRPRSPRSFLRASLIEHVAQTLGQPLTVFDAVLHQAAEDGIRMDHATYRIDEAALRSCEGHTGTCWRGNP
ncbi:hypothetical protein [Nocardiopsis sp. FR26]|uniref:hypothetical protein n=1 Tax=Nocardiopsis sp. FR26 TaxID=2605987 RepID=UPI00135994EB|nr:hypothetical protein [Nocardiopsis sp. FR26]